MTATEAGFNAPGAKFAMVPAEVIHGAPDPTCLRLYAYFDLRQGTDGWPAQGAQYVADQLGLQARTVLQHARHLVDMGWLELVNDPAERVKGGSQRQVRFRVVYNPVRNRINQSAKLIGTPAKRWRRPSKRIESPLTNQRASKGQDLSPYLIDLDCPARNAGRRLRETQDMAPTPVARNAGQRLCPATEERPVGRWADVPRKTQDIVDDSEESHESGEDEAVALILMTFPGSEEIAS